jgi:hypothetical protein
MVKAKRTKKAGKGSGGAIVPAKPKPRMISNIMSAYESKLLKMIVDPCSAELVPGLSLPAGGLCQRFTKYYNIGVTTENTVSMFFNPNSQSTTGGVIFRAALNTASPTYLFTDETPGQAFLETNSEYCSVLGYCVEVLYTGKLVDRRGFIGVCQAPWASLNDVSAATLNPSTLLPYCQATQPVLSEAVSVKYVPTLASFTGNGNTSELGQNGNLNGIMIVLNGVDPLNFVVKVTVAYEYTPKATTGFGIVAPRPTKTVPVGAAERIITALDRMGNWWHNVGDTVAAAGRLGGHVLYGAGQVARFARTAAQIARPAATVLALTG